MYRSMLFLFLALMPIFTGAQEPTDALRYSQVMNSGTARFVSMGGAFGALGSDFSTLTYNPAGLGVYKTSEFTFTPSFYIRSNESNYVSNLTSSSRSRFGFDNMGFVASFQSVKSEETGLVNFNLGFGYNKLADFYSESLAAGPNALNSIIDFFALRANGNTWQSMSSTTTFDPYINGNAPWEAILAWDNFLIDTLLGQSNSYRPMLNSGDGVNQEHSISSMGNMGEYVISMAANFSNKFYWGATIGIQSIYYKQVRNHTENAFNTNSPLPSGDLFRSMHYKQTYEVNGTGFNFKLGGIYRPIPELRIGFAAHTPTYLSLNEDYRASMGASFNWGNNNFSTPTNRNDYGIETPFKLIGSLAYTFGEIGLLSFDYERVDYTFMRLSSSSYSFSPQNQAIKNMYRSTQNLKVGGEVWIKSLALRGGYAMYGSPYSANDLNSNSSISVFSGGLGYRAGDIFIDVAYQYAIFQEKYYMYNLVDVNGESRIPAVTTDNSQGKFLMTLGFKF